MATTCNIPFASVDVQIIVIFHHHFKWSGLILYKWSLMVQPQNPWPAHPDVNKSYLPHKLVRPLCYEPPASV